MPTTFQDLLPIIVVEDSDEDFDTVREAIRNAAVDVEIRRASTGGRCLELLRAAPTRVAMVLMDLNTPGTDGREALVAIKSDPVLRSCPVVVLSGSANPKDVGFCYRAGANAYHVKPVRHPDHLQLVVDIAIYWLTRVVRVDAISEGQTS